MHYHIILTERCNLKCKYCYEKSMNEFENGLEEKWQYDEKVPFDSEVKVEELKRFLKSEDCLIFYGGEPLIMLDKMKEIMDNVECKFYLQTNGIFLNNMPLDYLLKLEKILVSVDGNLEITDKNKGSGHYNRVLNNLKFIRNLGFKGEIVARMVVSGNSDIYEQVLSLIKLIEQGLIDSIHWQIDAGFYKNDFDLKEFKIFVKKYNNSVSKLVSWWIKEISEKSKVWKIYPFIGILNRLMKWDKETRLQCGAGYKNFTINTSGKLSACPILNSVKNFYCGSLNLGIEKEIFVSGCENCEIFSICGGRCLYWNYAKLWPKEGDELICDTIKFIVNKINENVPKIKILLTKNVVSKKDFEYEKYFGPEIIP